MQQATGHKKFYCSLCFDHGTYCISTVGIELFYNVSCAQKRKKLLSSCVSIRNDCVLIQLRDPGICLKINLDCCTPNNRSCSKFRFIFNS